MPPGGSLTIEVACAVRGLDPFVSAAEVMASAATDPDSIPGNGNPDEDDFASLTVYPEP